MNNYTVHIVSQRLMFRKTFAKLASLLDADVMCVEHAQSPQALTVLPTSNEGAVLLDCGTSDPDQLIECMLHLLSLQPEATVILVLDEQDDTVVDAGMDMGATGVIIKASPPQIIIDSLHRILAGERCRPAPVRVVAREDIPEDIRIQLSARQQKMLRAIVGGQSISATARELSITPAKLVTEMRQVIATIRGRAF